MVDAWSLRGTVVWETFDTMSTSNRRRRAQRWEIDTSELDRGVRDMKCYIMDGCRYRHVYRRLGTMIAHREFAGRRWPTGHASLFGGRIPKWVREGCLSPAYFSHSFPPITAIYKTHYSSRSCSPISPHTYHLSSLYRSFSSFYLRLTQAFAVLLNRFDDKHLSRHPFCPNEYNGEHKDFTKSQECCQRVSCQHERFPASLERVVTAHPSRPWYPRPHARNLPALNTEVDPGAIFLTRGKSASVCDVESWNRVCALPPVFY